MLNVNITSNVYILQQFSGFTCHGWFLPTKKIAHPPCNLGILENLSLALRAFLKVLGLNHELD